MTAIASILKSYFNPRRFVFWLLVAWAFTIPVSFSAMLFVAYSAKVMFPPAFSYSWPLFGFCFGILAMGIHLRETLLEGEEADLLPHYHARHLASVVIIMTACLFVCLALMRFLGLPPLPTLAIILGITAMTLWFGYYVLGGLIFLIFLPLTATLFFPGSGPGNVIIEAFQTVWMSVGAFGTAWSIALIALSLGGIILFCGRYLKTNCASAYNRRFFIGYINTMRNFSLPGLIPALENENLRMDKMAGNAVSRIVAARRGQLLSFFQLTRLIGLAMYHAQEHNNRFNYNWSSNKGRIAAAFYGVFAVIYGLVVSRHHSGDTLMLFLLPCTIMTYTAFTFQSNKNQLPMLYLQTDLPTKYGFLKAAAMGYFLFVAEPLFIFIGVALTMLVFFPILAWPRMFQIVIMIIAMALGYASVLLLTGNRRKTQPGMGWIFGFIMLYVPFIVIERVVASWIVVGITILAGALFFCFALRRWTKSEMDCA